MQDGILSDQFGAFYYDADPIPGPNDLNPKNKREYDRYTIAINKLRKMATKTIDGYAGLNKKRKP